MHSPTPTSSRKRTDTSSEDPLPTPNNKKTNTTTVTTNPNPNPNTTPNDLTDSRKAGREIQRKCDILQKIHTQREQLTSNLLKLKQIANKGGIPRAFQTRIKLIYPGVNLPKSLRDQWWETEREVGKTLLQKAIQINEALVSSTEDNLAKMKRETMALAKHPALNPKEKELWHLFVQQTMENLKANTEDTLRERANKERKTPNTTPTNRTKDGKRRE